MTKNSLQKIVNYLSGTASCMAGVLLIIKGDMAAGLGLITAGVTKIAAHEMQQSEVKKITSELRTNEAIKINGKTV